MLIRQIASCAKKVAGKRKPRTCIGLLVCWATLGNSPTRGQVFLYDNTELLLGAGELLVHPDEAWLFAQPFRTDQDNTTITSISIPIGNVGSPSGEMRFSIWDDDRGTPGQVVGEVGKIADVGLLPFVAPSQEVMEKITFQRVVTGLRPDSTYYVVLDLTDANSTPGRIMNNVINGALRSTIGTNDAGSLLATDRSTTDWFDVSEKVGQQRYLQMSVAATRSIELQAGDADQDLDFDQLDLVQIQVAAKYLTEQSATWGEGDWNAAPGGSPGAPPPGDGVFNQFDIIAAQQGATYLTGPYAALQSNGTPGDSQTSVVYNAGTGELAVDAPAGIELTSINIDSGAGIFTGEASQNLGGSFDNDADANIFKATFGSSFGSLSFGDVAQAGLSEQFVLEDLTVIGSLAGGGDLGNVDLVYVPEPTSAILLAVGLVLGTIGFGRSSGCK